MSLTTVRAHVEGKKLDRKHAGGKNWTLSFTDGSTPVTFKYLGAGTNKVVFLVEGTQWVLCLQGNEKLKSDVAKQDFEGEIDTLVRLGTHGVHVPLPFPGMTTAQSLFQCEVDNHESGSDFVPLWAFLEEFLDNTHYIEMDKKDPSPEAFVKTKCLTQPDAKRHVQQTMDTFETIQKAWIAGPWGDFQVLYDKRDGIMKVFDPMPKPDSNKPKIDRALVQWEKDLVADGGKKNP